MTDNFNFDDLPDWLKGSGADGKEPAPDDDLSSIDWESQKPSGPSGGGRLGVTGQLPWLQGNDPNEGPRRSSELEGFDWDTLDDDSDEQAPAAPALQRTNPTGDLPSWIMDAEDDAEEIGLEGDFADLFSSAVDETDAQETPSELGLKRVEPSGPKIRKLGEKDTAPDPSEMTFEEWERFQEEQEYRKENAAQIQVEQDIPDWFRDNVDLGDAERSLDAILLDDFDDAPAAPSKPATDNLNTGANYVPEWFLGLEEHNLEEAPDWVRDATASTDIRGLTDSSMFALPPEPEPELAFDEPLFAEEATASDDWLGSIAKAQDESLSELDDLMADAAVLAANAPNTAYLLSDVLLQEKSSSIPDAEMDWLTSSSDDSFDMMIQTSGDMDDGFLPTGDIPDTDDFIAMVQTPDTSPGWMSEPSQPSEADDDDLFAALLSEGDEFSSDSVDWLGDVDDLDFSGADAFDDRPAPPPDTPRPAASREDVRRALKNTGSVDQILTDLLSTTAAPKGIAIDNQSRALVRAGGEDDIDDLFEDVDDDFLAALNSSDVLPAIDERPAEAAQQDLPPGWIETLRPDRQVRLAAGGIELDFEQRSPDSLPANVQALREASVAISQVNPTEATLDSGALAGITGGLPVINLDRPEAETALQTGVMISPQQSQRIEMLTDVLEVGDDEDGDTDQSTARPRRKVRRRARLKLDRTLVAAALMGAVAGPFITDALHLAEEPDVTNIAVQQATVFGAIDALEANDRVLIAFEYGPTAAGELNPLAKAVLLDLFNQGVIPVTLSTNPLGGTNSQFVVQGVATDADFLDYLERDARLSDDQDYYSIGFVSGGPIAIRALSRSEASGVLVFDASVSEDGTPLEIGRVDAADFAMVLVIAETTEDLRNWAEQFQVEGLPKYALVTTAIEPIASAYLTEDTGYMGYLAGYRDTYRYNQIRNAALRTPIENTTDLPDPEVAQWHSMALGALAASGVIVLGTLLNLIRGIGKRRK